MQKDNSYIITLFESICQDDQKAFEEIFDLLYERLLNFCIIYVKDKEYAEEIVSNVFLKLWMKRKELNIQNPETYLFMAVKNRSLNHIKQYSNYKVSYISEKGFLELVNTHDPGKEMERRELVFKMNQAIETLPLQCRIVFKLVKEEGLRYKQVAEILEISPRTVETQLVRAVRKLDEFLSPYVDQQAVKSKKNKIKSSGSGLL